MAQDTLLGFPAHTLPYRCGGFTTLSTVSIFIRFPEYCLEAAGGLLVDGDVVAAVHSLTLSNAAEGVKFSQTMNEFVEKITSLGRNVRLEDLRCRN